MNRIKTFGHLKEFCTRKLNQYQMVLDKLNKSQEEDEVNNVYGAQVYFFQWHLMNLGEAAAHANIASSLLKRFGQMDETLEIDLKTKHQFLKVLLQQTQTLTDRSTSAAANFMEDATRTFWQELNKAIMED